MAAEEDAQSSLLSIEQLRRDLEEERSALQAFVTIVKDLEDLLVRLDSEQYKAKVIDGWRQGPLDKTEVALACKAGVDHLVSLLPPEVHPVPNRIYPPRVSCCLDLLKEIEASGGGLELVLDGDELSDDTPGGDL